MRLLFPFLHSLRHRFLDHRQRARTSAIVLFALVLLGALYLVSYRVLGYFQAQNEVGSILSLRIMQMTWLITFAMLLFSSMISGISALFLSQDNTIVGAAPVGPEEILAMRHITTGLHTSWMMVLFSLPVFTAYGAVFQATAFYWPLLLFSLVSLAATATGLGLGTSILLVNLFPARRTKDIVVYLSLLSGILLYLVLRLIKPEQLADPDRFPDFIDYLDALSTPLSPMLPPSWAAEMLSSLLLDHRIDWLLTGLLLCTPIVAFLFAELLMQTLFFRGYSKAQESFGGGRVFRAPPYRPGRLIWFFRKELRMLIRDSNEWSQFFLVAALVVVYLYNFKALPLERSPMPSEYLSNLIAYANIGLTGFLVASLAARFVYPSVGMEGAAFGLILTGPVSLERYLLAKYLFYALPFTLLALILVLVSNHLLGVQGPMQWISLGSGLLITWSVVAMALGFGAAHADFQEENRAATLGSLGAILFLLCALSFELVCITLGSVPAYRVTKAWLRNGLVTGDGLLLPAMSLAAMISLALAVAYGSLRWGKKRVRMVFR